MISGVNELTEKFKTRYIYGKVVLDVLLLMIRLIIILFNVFYFVPFLKLIIVRKVKVMILKLILSCHCSSEKLWRWIWKITFVNDTIVNCVIGLCHGCIRMNSMLFDVWLSVLWSIDPFSEIFTAQDVNNVSCIVDIWSWWMDWEVSNMLTIC